VRRAAAGAANQGLMLDLTYRVRLRPGCSLAGLVADLNAFEVVQLARGE